MWEVDLHAWWRTVHINLFGALVYTRLALARMVPRRRGRIVNITSQADAFRWPTVSAYSVHDDLDKILRHIHDVRDSELYLLGMHRLAV